MRDEFAELMPDTVDLEGADGTRTEGIRCQFDGRTVITMDVAKVFRADDVLVRTLPNGLVERHKVLSADYVAPGDALAHVQMRVEKMNAIEKLLGRAVKPSSDIEVFISHSGQDERAAEKLVALLSTATGLEKKQIRCTSVDGSRLKTGSDTESVVLGDIRNARAFIGLISKASVASGYVMFELGARWALGGYFAPVLLAPNSYSLLPAWLPGKQAVRSKDRPGMQRVLREIADELGRSLRDADSYETEFKAFLATRERSKNAKADAAAKTKPPSRAGVDAPRSPLPPLTRDESLLRVQSEILKKFSREGDSDTIDLLEYCSNAGFADAKEDDFIALIQGLVGSGLQLVTRTGRLAKFLHPHMIVVPTAITNKW